jgi:hypothetical protein
MVIGRQSYARLVWSRPVSVVVVTCREGVWRSVYVVFCLCRRVAEFVSGVGQVGSDCNREVEAQVLLKPYGRSCGVESVAVGIA